MEGGLQSTAGLYTVQSEKMRKGRKYNEGKKVKGSCRGYMQKKV